MKKGRGELRHKERSGNINTDFNVQPESFLWIN